MDVVDDGGEEVKKKYPRLKIKELIEGCQPSRQWLNENKILHLACKNDEVEIVEILITCGADVTEIDNDSRTPFLLNRNLCRNPPLKPLLLTERVGGSQFYRIVIS